jgi:large subunit ribosomal protein L35
MPKLKTRKSAAKRFRTTGTGKVMRRKAYKNHMLEHKSTKRKTSLSQPEVLNDADAERVRLMMPYA